MLIRVSMTLKYESIVKRLFGSSIVTVTTNIVNLKYKTIDLRLVCTSWSRQTEVHATQRDTVDSPSGA